jgi:hypothetical protein
MTVGSAALAIGAGAALLYRSGGSKVIGQGVEKAAKLVNAIQDDIAELSLKDVSYDRGMALLDKHITGSNSTWKQLSNEIDDKFSLRFNSNTLVGAMKQRLDIAGNKASKLSREYDYEKIAKPLMNQFKSAYNSEGNDFVQSRINGLVNDTIKHLDEAVDYEDAADAVLNKDFLSKHFSHTNISETDQHKMMEDLLKAIRKNDSELPQYIRDNEFIIDAMTDINVDELAKKYGRRGQTTFFDQLLGDVSATVNDIIEAADAGRLRSVSIDEDINEGQRTIIDELRRLKDQHQGFGDLYVDNFIRKNDRGEVYSFSKTSDFFNKFIDEAANTLPGKIFHARDIIKTSNPDVYDFISAGTANPIIAAKYEKTGSMVLSDSYVWMMDRLYRVDKTNRTNPLQPLVGGDKFRQFSGQHGSIPGLITSMAGNADRKIGKDNFFSKQLDMLNGISSPGSGIKAFLSKFEDDRWGRNIINDFLYQDVSKMPTVTDAEGLNNYFKRVKRMNRLFSDTTRELDRNTIYKLKKHASSEAKTMLDWLTLSDQELIQHLVSKNTAGFQNPELSSLVRSYMKDSERAMSKMTIMSEKTPWGSTRAIKYPGMLRRELAKEAFLTESALNGNDDAILKLLKKSGLTGTQFNEASFLSNWAVFQREAGIYMGDTKPKQLDDIRRTVGKVSTLFSASTEQSDYRDHLRKSMKTMATEKISMFERGFQQEDNDIIRGQKFGHNLYVQKTVSVLDMLKSLNDATIRKSFVKQFTAGRKNMGDVTTTTMFPYFGLARLVDPLSKFGLNFSARSTGSTLGLAKNIMLKRVIPIAGAATTLSYLNFEAKNLTGTSLLGALGNTTANLDLMMRKAADTIGISNIFETGRHLNPMSQYLFGPEYQDYEERKQWYESGVSPVRKGRWWSFGSTSEWRGGKIEYFAPNWLRQVQSDYHDISLYGSSNEKWKHSLIPTPRHPLAPLRYLMDPYWVERKHSWDRPYPVSGKLFTEGTPWGAILNPTVGQLVKPQIRMHREELGNTLVDVRALIAQRNEDTKRKANENYGLIQLDGSGITPVSYSALGNPTGGQAIMNMKISNGKVVSSNIAGYGYEKSTQSINDFGDIQGAVEKSTMVVASSMSVVGRAREGSRRARLSLAEWIDVNAGSNPLMSMVSTSLRQTPTYESLSNIEQINTATKTKAAGPSQGVITPDSIFKTQAKYGRGLLYHDEAASDIRNVASTKEFLRDASYSARELGGIYGFLFDEVMPSKRTKRLASADKMYSFANRFWDANVGGMGGEFMEIARRFFPHEDHSVQRINPLMNTMPDWMPERFRYGDPYSAIPKGEMRMPGAGYETLNKLHPDMYGRYGAFDRFKVLADIAPGSTEYKTWRDIASKTIKDPAMRGQIKTIKDQVIRQSRGHEFYPYRFLGSNLDRRSAVVDKILSDSSFTVLGDSSVYKMAGVKMTKGESLSNYLQAGMSVNIRYDKGANGSGPDGSISAIVMLNGENLNRELLQSKKAEKRNDITAAGVHAQFTQSQIDRGKIYELIAHAPIPVVHSKFMRVDSPLESYKNEQVYGTSYATWSHPLQGFVYPAFKKSFARSHPAEIVGNLMWRAASLADASGNKALKIAGNTAWALTNPGAFVGGTIGYGVTMSSKYAKIGATIGASIGNVGYMLANGGNPFEAAIEFGITGFEITSRLFPKNMKAIKTGVAVGAAAGVALAGIKNPGLGNPFQPYIPKSTKKRWEIEEYYDRLNYIKYMGLYSKASRKAMLHEGVDIKSIVDTYERDAKTREKIRKQLLASQRKVSNSYSEGDPRKRELLMNINSKLSALSYPEQIIHAGKYTRAALAYKQAAESTMYGLKDNSSWAQLLRAMPKSDRDYILEFAKERDSKKQKEIMEYLSPYKRRVLQIAWGQKPKKLASNTQYFSKHYLPGPFWAGWQPDVDLDNVEIKTIKNEGMLLSDFGFYDSQANTPEAQAAPNINMKSGTSPIELRKNLITVLNGMGLTGVNVTLEPSSQSGIQVIANIARIADYNIKGRVNSVMDRVFF